MALPCGCAAADWRAEADRSIERIRKGDAAVRVVNAAGQPVAGARVSADLVRHAFWFGTALNAGMFRPEADPDDAQRYKEIARSHFNAAVHENSLKWYHTQRGGRDPDFSDADRVLQWCQANGLRMRGHCIFWGKYKYVPAWQKELDDPILRRAVLERAQRVTSRYRGRINEFDLNNEMLDPDFYADRLGKDITRAMARAALDGNPAARLYVNDYAILAGHQDRPERYVAQIKDLIARGVPVGGIGLQGHFIGNRPDPVKVRRALDLVAQFHLPIRITEYDCTEDPDGSALDTVYRIAFAHPAVTGILMWGFWEGKHWKPKAALWERDWTPTPRAARYKALVLDEWHTRASGKTGADGDWHFRGFYGDYRLRAEGPGGQTAETDAALSPGAPARFTLRLE